MKTSLSIKQRLGKILAACSVCALLSVCLMGCSSSNNSGTNADTSTGAAQTINESNYDLDYTTRDLTQTYDTSATVNVTLADENTTVSGSGASYSNGVLTISDEGIYVLSGTLSNGQIMVDATDDAKVQIVLNGASITNSSGSAIYVQNADKCFITTDEGTTNTLSDGSAYATTEEDGSLITSATIYSECDLTLNGIGTLNINGNQMHGVYSKDDIVATGGTINIISVTDGIHGKDCVKVNAGTINITAGDDGIVSDKDDDSTKGYVSIDGGSINISSTDKGIVAFNYLRVTGGTITLDSGDDALHCDGCLKVADGSISITAGDDAVHCEYVLQIDGGTTNISSCYEGFEGQTVNITGGTNYINASDDGINAASANTSNSNDTSTDTAQALGDMGNTGNEMNGDAQGGAQVPDAQASNSQAPDNMNGPAPTDMDNNTQGNAQMPSDIGDGGQNNAQAPNDMNNQAPDVNGDGAGAMDVDSNCSINITGGYTIVVASGDGLDSNGSITQSDGVVLISGPENSDNGALDYGITYTMTGGTIVAVGSSGMAQGISDPSQAWINANASGNSGDSVAIVDSSGNVVASMTAMHSFQLVEASCAGMTDGASYTVVVGGTVANSDEYGYATKTTVSGGTSTSATATTTGSSEVAMGGMGNMDAGMQGGGQAPNDMNGQAPSDMNGGMPQGQATSESASNVGTNTQGLLIT